MTAQLCCNHRTRAGRRHNTHRTSHAAGAGSREAPDRSSKSRPNRARHTEAPGWQTLAGRRVAPTAAPKQSSCRRPRRVQPALRPDRCTANHTRPRPLSECFTCPNQRSSTGHGTDHVGQGTRPLHQPARRRGPGRKKARNSRARIVMQRGEKRRMSSRTWAGTSRWIFPFLFVLLCVRLSQQNEIEAERFGPTAAP